MGRHVGIHVATGILKCINRTYDSYTYITNKILMHTLRNLLLLITPDIYSRPLPLLLPT